MPYLVNNGKVNILEINIFLKVSVSLSMIKFRLSDLII